MLALKVALASIFASFLGLRLIAVLFAGAPLTMETIEKAAEPSIYLGLGVFIIVTVFSWTSAVEQEHQRREQRGLPISRFGQAKYVIAKVIIAIASALVLMAVLHRPGRGH